MNFDHSSSELDPKRPRHPEEDLEELLQVVERAGWPVSPRTGYDKVFCPVASTFEPCICRRPIRTIGARFYTGSVGSPAGPRSADDPTDRRLPHRKRHVR